MYVGRAFQMPIGVTCRHVEAVERPSFIDEVLRRRLREFREEARDNVAPCLLSPREMERFHCILGRLVRGKAGPVVTPVIP